MNHKSVQILRGAKSYDPATSSEVLLDGQPFYSKKTKKLYIGDGITPLSELEGTQLGSNVTVSDDKLTIKADLGKNNIIDVSIDMIDIPDINTQDQYPNKILACQDDGKAGWRDLFKIIPIQTKATKDIIISAGSDFDQLPPVTRTYSYPEITTNLVSELREANQLGTPVILRWDSTSGDYTTWSVVNLESGTTPDWELALVSSEGAILKYYDAGTGQYDPIIYPIFNEQELQTKADIYPKLPPNGSAMVQVRDNYYGDDKIRHLEITVRNQEWAIARRGAEGTIQVSDATSELDAINKRSMEAAINASQTPITPDTVVSGNSEITAGVIINPKGMNTDKIANDVDVIKPSDSILKYTIIGKICYVTYAFTAAVDIPNGGTYIATGMPPAFIGQYFSCQSSPLGAATDKTPYLVNFMVTDAGSIKTQYGRDFKANHFVKGGFSYIIQ